MRTGRVLSAAVLGCAFMLFVAVDLVLFGVVSLNSVVVTVLPVVGLLASGLLAAWAGRHTSGSAF